MSRAIQERIFEPFYTTKGEGRGTGLGLATVYAVTRQLGAHLEVDSVEGRGTCFTFHLPCVADVDPLASSSGWPRPQRLVGTVLLVEDEPLLRLATRHHLESLGLEVVEAQDAREALELAKDHSGGIDALVSNVVLPRVRGPQLAIQLRQRFPDLPVLFITANPEFLTADERALAGVSVLRKPFGRAELGAELGALLRPRVAPAAGDVAPTILVVEDDPQNSVRSWGGCSARRAIA